MKRRSRTKPAFSGSGETSFAPNLKAKGKGEGKQQRSDETSSRRSVSSGEEASGKTRRPRKKETRRCVGRHTASWDPDPSTASAFFQGRLVPKKNKGFTGHSTTKEKSSASQSKENNARGEERSSSDCKGEIDAGDVQVSSGIVRRPNEDQQVKHSGRTSNQPANNSEGDAHVAAEASAAPLSAVVGDSTCDIFKDGCLEGAKLLNMIGSVEAQEKACFDEETRAMLKVEENKKTKSSYSLELGSVVHSGKNTSSGDLGKMVAQDEDGQHLETIGAHAVEDLKQGIGRAGEHVQALLDMDDDTILRKIYYYLDQLKFDPPNECDYLPLLPYETHDLTKVHEQLALYRIRGYQLSVERQLAELDDESLKKHYSSTFFYEEGYFQYYEESLEWYFDPELCKNPEFDYYQRLVLYNHGEYRDWDYYHSTLNTFEKDLAYVQYYETLVNETKWIEDHLEHSKHKWNRVENVAKIQALQIAAGFPYVSLRLLLFAFNELIWSILFDHSHYTKMDSVYFEIWKRVAKLKMDFREALCELHRKNMFPLRTLDIEYELEDGPRRFYMKNDYDAYIADIDETASDDDAREKIVEAVVKMIPKPKIYLDYIQEKVDIAKDILLIEEVSGPCQSDIGS